MFPAVHSVSVVPVGVTKYREGLYPLRPYTREEAGAVVDQVEAFAAAHRDAHGTALVWCSDEFYLLAGRPLPEEDYYEEFTQLDNGVGMLRLLRQEFRRGLDLMEAEEMERTVPFSIATGVSAAPFLTELVELARKKCGKIEGRCTPSATTSSGRPSWWPDWSRGRPDRSAAGEEAGGASAHPRQYAPPRGAGLFG